MAPYIIWQGSALKVRFQGRGPLLSETRCTIRGGDGAEMGRRRGGDGAETGGDGAEMGRRRGGDGRRLARDWWEAGR